jgi:TolB-like protein
MMLAAIAAIGVAAWWYAPRDAGLAGKASIAVLPFENLSGDEATARLADGLTEDIITDLSRWREFDVIARNSTAVYKGKPVDVRQVGRELDVRYVLEGSVQRHENKLRLTAQLVSAETGAHLWSERWDRPAEDVFAVQSEIAQQVAVKISLGDPLWQSEYAAARRKLPQDLTAYELYLLGSEKMDSPTKESVEEAIRLLTEAVERDPGLVRGWVQLAGAYEIADNFGADPEESFAAAISAAKRAVQLDPMDAHAHDILAVLFASSGDFEKAKKEFETALSLNPGSAGLLMSYAGWAGALGEPERGAEAADRAIRLNPNYPVWAGNTLRHAYFAVGRYEDALRIVERQPFETLTRYGLVTRAAIYAGLDRLEEAKDAVADTLAQYPDLTIESFISDPGMSDDERRRFTETMRKAGFPVCAKDDGPADAAVAALLPECSVPAPS